MLRLPFKKLQIWQKSLRLSLLSYKATKSFPKEELYGLISQIRRASVSVSANIAEGSQRTTNKDFANFILIAKGSLAELETHIFLAQQLKYLREGQVKQLINSIEELHKMIYAFHSKLIAHH